MPGICSLEALVSSQRQPRCLGDQEAAGAPTEGSVAPAKGPVGPRLNKILLKKGGPQGLVR